MPHSRYLLAALAACVGCTQTPPTDLSTSPSAATALTVSEIEAAASDEVEPSEVEPSTEIPASIETGSLPEPAPQPALEATKPRTAAKPVIASYSANVPAVLMSASECAGCAVTVGDQMPAIQLPKVGGGEANLASLAGKRATVVLFWGADRWMSRDALADLQREFAASAAGEGVAFIGVAVGLKPEAATAELEKSSAQFAQLLDADGKSLAQLGGPDLPRLYVLDAAGKIAWFDIDYSEASRRELDAALEALTSIQP